MLKYINEYIDHTLLRPEATPDDIKRLCCEAEEYGFYAVCVNPYCVKTAASALNGSAVKIACVVGFPLGASDTTVKAYETVRAVNNGASEIDMVMNIGLLKAGKNNEVASDIAAVTAEAHAAGAVVKVIIETCLLNDDEIVTACLLSQRAGADFIKTSTGFASGGATVENVSLIKRTVGDRLKIKASGGIRDLGTALAMIEAGAERLGVSAGVKIMREYNAAKRR